MTTIQSRPSLDQIFNAPPSAIAQPSRPSLDQIFGGIPSQVPQHQPGFFSRVNSDLEQRGKNMADIVNATKTGQQLPNMGTLEAAGNEVGAAGDIIGQGIKSGYQALPQLAQNAIGNAASDIMKTPLGQAGIKALQAGQAAWDPFEKQHPNIARYIRAVGNIGTAIAPIGESSVAGVALDAGKSATELAGSGIEGAGQLLAKMKSGPLPTSQDIKGMAGAAYDVADKSGGILKSDVANRLYDSIDQMKPQTAHGIAITGEDALSGLSDRIATLRDKPITLQAAQEMDEGLSQLIDKYVDKTTGSLDKEGQKLYEVQSNFRNMIENAGADDVEGGTKGFEALKDGRNLWSTAMRIGDMERIITRAQMTDNPATSIKAGFRTLYNNASRMRGYTDAEKAAIKNAAEGGIISDTLRTVIGSRLLSLAAGATGGGFAGAALSVPISAASRGVATAMQGAKANKAIRQVAQRIPKNIGSLSPEEAQKILRGIK